MIGPEASKPCDNRYDWTSTRPSIPFNRESHPSSNSIEARKDHIRRIQHQIQTGTTAPSPMTSKAVQEGLPAPRQRTSPLKKSRSIQIKRNRRGSDEFPSSSVSASAEQMYDWATWRMYHRITTARRAKSSITPLPSGNMSYQDTVAGSRTYRGLSGFPRNDGQETDSSPTKAVVQAERSDFDEGIFMMDL